MKLLCFRKLSIPERDIIVVPAHRVADQRPFLLNRWGIDATKSTGKEREFYLKARPPGVDKVDYV